MAKLPSFRRRDLMVPWRMGDMVFFFLVARWLILDDVGSVTFLPFLLRLILSIGLLRTLGIGGHSRKTNSDNDQGQQSNLFTVL